MRFELRQFREVLRVRNHNGEPYILIGGQAVNFWATRYLAHEPGLPELLPFTSADIDFKGTRSDVIHIAQQLGLRGVFPLKVAMTALAGAVPLRIGGAPSTVEVVRRVPGVTNKEAEDHALEREFEGERIRVLDPISLLHAKAHLALSVSQEERRDVHHVKILVPCVRAFLREALEIAEHDPALVRGWLGAVNKTLSLTETTVGSRLSRRFGVNWLGIHPRKEMDRSRLPGVIRLRNERLPRWEQKLATAPYQARPSG